MSQTKTIYISEINYRHTVIRLRKDGIIELTGEENHNYDVADVKENHEAIKKLSGDKKAFVLTIPGRYGSVTREARDYVGSGPHADFIQAEAFIVQSLAQKILVRFYMKINKPKVKSGFFSDTDAALKWLKDLQKNKK